MPAPTPALTAALAALHARPHGVDLYVRADLDKGAYGGFIKVRLDPDFLAMLHRRHQYCQAEGLADMNQRLAPAAWSTEPGTILGGWHLSIDVESFTYIGREQNGGPKPFESAPIYTGSLTQMLACPDLQKTHPDQPRAAFTWVGNSLVHEEEGNEGFVETILDRCPEVAAAQRALDMAARLGAVAGAVVRVGSDIPVRRRRASV